MKGIWTKALVAIVILGCLRGVTVWGIEENDGPGARGVNGILREGKAVVPRGSTFKPPKASDVQFVITSGGDLGKTAGSGYQSHTINIPVNIDRVFGNLDNLLENGGLPETVTLRMIVWDVDSDSTYYPPERDVVLVNGTKVGELSGHNQIWTDNTFQVPIKVLHLKSSPEDSGANTIQVNVDVDDGGWITQVEWVSFSIPAPPPVVLSHGIRNDEDAYALAYLQERLEDLGLPVHSFSYDNHGNYGIREDAPRLKKEVEDAKRKFNVESVNIVAHSMGGLKARQYAEGCKNSEIIKILQIATPNGGSPIADVVLGIQNCIPSAIEGYVINDFILGKIFHDKFKAKLNDGMIRDLAEETMKGYNEGHPFNDKIWYGVVAGGITDISITGDFLYWLGHKWLKISKGYADNDAIVPAVSAFTTPSNSSFKTTHLMLGASDRVNHSQLVLDGVHDWLPLASMHHLARELLQQKDSSKTQMTIKSNGARLVCHTAQRAMGTETSSSGSLMRVGTWDGTTSKQFPFSILKGEESMVMLSFANCNEIKAKLISPSGKTYSNTENGVDVWVDTNAFVCVLERPEVGEWTVEVTAVPGNAEGIADVWYMLVQAEEDCGVSMSAEFKERYVDVGIPLTLKAETRLDGLETSGTYSAHVTFPDGSRSVIEMKDDGQTPDEHAHDGVYAAFVPTSMEGQYFATVSANIETPVAFSRSQLVSGVAYGSPAVISNVSASVSDPDGNGYYDELILDVGINVEKLATYRAVASLSDENGNLMAQSCSENIECLAGANSLSVAFDGEAIYQYGASSEYTVSSVKLFEVTPSYEAMVDVKEGILSINNWQYDQFEHASLHLGEDGREMAIDNDKDGIYDELDVMLPLVSEGALSGLYQWSAALVDGKGTVLAFVSGQVNFPYGGGTTDISMVFDGRDIANSKKDGPYYVKNIIFWGNNETFTLSDQFATRAYRIQEWGGTSEVMTAEAEIGWKFLKATGTWFAQLRVAFPGEDWADVLRLRYLFADRIGEDGKMMAGLWSSKNRAAVAATEVYGGETYRAVALDASVLAMGDGKAVYGVQNLGADGVPVAERGIEMYVRKRVSPDGGNESAAGVEDFVGYVAWEAGGATHAVPVAAGIVQEELSVLRSMTVGTRGLSVPIAAKALNRSLAVGVALDDGAEPYCTVASYQTAGGRMYGTIEVGATKAGKIRRGELGANASVSLLGANTVAGPYVELGRAEVGPDRTFEMDIPEGATFFRFRIDVAETVK